MRRVGFGSAIFKTGQTSPALQPQRPLPSGEPADVAARLDLLEQTVLRAVGDGQGEEAEHHHHHGGALRALAHPHRHPVHVLQQHGDVDLPGR